MPSTYGGRDEEALQGQRRADQKAMSEDARAGARQCAKGPSTLEIAPPAEETEVARLARELTDERRQRTATSEVLRLLSGSHGDLNHLFDTILANATNLCQANFGTLSLCEDDAFRIVAMHN